jgi:hypothetical protein
VRVPFIDGCDTSSAPAKFTVRYQISATFNCKRSEGGAPFWRTTASIMRPRSGSSANSSSPSKRARNPLFRAP